MVSHVDGDFYVLPRHKVAILGFQTQLGVVTRAGCETRLGQSYVLNIQRSQLSCGWTASDNYVCVCG